MGRSDWVWRLVSKIRVMDASSSHQVLGVQLDGSISGSALEGQQHIGLGRRYLGGLMADDVEFRTRCCASRTGMGNFAQASGSKVFHRVCLEEQFAVQDAPISLEHVTAHHCCT